MSLLSLILKNTSGLVFCGALLLGGCAGRAPNPVGVVQPQDRFMDCAAISVEVQANNKKISELGSEEGGKVAQNVIVGVAGLLIPILWFGMDFQNSAGKEVAAVQARQQYLATLAESRCGAVPPVPIQMVPTSVQPSPPGAPVSSPNPNSGKPKVAVPITPVTNSPSELNCVHPDGTRIRVTGSNCPSPSNPS